jgi:chloramphenicol 3-O-phosphotransferase
MSDPRSCPSAVPSEAVRAAVTVALGVYLVGLLLTVLGNSSSGSSALVRTLKGRLFSPWLVPAWLDLGFEQHLTHGVPEDADHAIEIRRAGARRDDDAILRYPGAVGGERAARWRRLARAIATGGGGDPAVLAAAVGRGGFTALDTQDVTVRVLRRMLPERNGPADDGPPRQAYAARVRMVDGDLQLIGSEDRGELAPLRRVGEAVP